MKKIIWAAAHDITEEQRDSLQERGELVILKEDNFALWSKITSIKKGDNLKSIANELLAYVRENVLVQPAGNPAFLTKLGILIGLEQEALHSRGALETPSDVLFSHSDRVSEDKIMPDGSIQKISVFRHSGWVSVYAQ